MSVLDVLINAKAELNHLGWGQGSYVTDAGTICLGEAINRVTVPDWSDQHVPLTTPTVALLARIGNFTYPFQQGEEREFASLSDWNDVEGRTEEEVFALLNQAIATVAV